MKEIEIPRKYIGREPTYFCFHFEDDHLASASLIGEGQPGLGMFVHLNT